MTDTIESVAPVSIHKEATEDLHSDPCPGCGFEPEVIHYWVEKVGRKRVGYTCTCGARVIYGIIQMMGDR